MQVIHRPVDYKMDDVQNIGNLNHAYHLTYFVSLLILFYILPSLLLLLLKLVPAAFVNLTSLTVHKKNIQHVNPKQIIMVASTENAVTLSGTLGNTKDAHTNTVIVDIYTNDCLSPTSSVLVSGLCVI